MPDWARGYQVTPNPDRVTWDFHFEADAFADGVQHVWRDEEGRWCVRPEKEQSC